jgi:hypothetical protein
MDHPVQRGGFRSGRAWAYARKVARARSVLISSLISADKLGRGWSRFGRLMLEALIYGILGGILTHTWGAHEGGVISIFLAAAALRGRVEDLLEEHRQSVTLKQRTEWQASRTTALSLLALFTGILVAYVGLALWLGDARSARLFRFALRVARVGQETILTRPYPQLEGLLIHNGLVLLAVFALAFIYRSYATVLSLVWNACVWALALTFLVRLGIKLHRNDLNLVILSAAAMLPHLFIEAVAYLVGAMSAIVLSEALWSDRQRQGRVREDVRRGVMALLAALGLLAVAGLVEWISFGLVHLVHGH